VIGNDHHHAYIQKAWSRWTASPGLQQPWIRTEEVPDPRLRCISASEVKRSKSKPAHALVIIRTLSSVETDPQRIFFVLKSSIKISVK
jgi:hypothetical protein